MSKNKARGQEIRDFIINHVSEHPSDVASKTAAHFHISRQAVSKHIRILVDDEILKATGSTRDRIYSLPTTNFIYSLSDALEEDTIWSNDIAPFLGGLPANVMGIWQHGVTEMINNAIDHSEGQNLIVACQRNAHESKVIVQDDGVGIFRKITKALGLEDEKLALLELSKGKFTTAPDSHAGEGIFFTSRMFDYFAIRSGKITYLHDDFMQTDELFENLRFNSKTGTSYPLSEGTSVHMQIKNKASRTTREIFDAFASNDDYSFAKTMVPVALAQYASNTLVSRSQAKRVLARIDRFETVVFDFEGVTEIGQAFADEIFRVFANAHPKIDISIVNAVDDVQKMISRARNAK